MIQIPKLFILNTRYDLSDGDLLLPGLRIRKRPSESRIEREPHRATKIREELYRYAKNALCVQISGI